MPPFNREASISEIETALRCPVDWPTVFRIEGPADVYPLERLWLEILEKNEVGSETIYLRPWNNLEDETDEELRSILINVRTWATRARSEYEALVFRFTHLKYASRDIYNKHMPPKSDRTTHQINVLSKESGISKFYKEIPSDFMLGAFFTGLFFHFDSESILIDGPISDSRQWEHLLYDKNCRLVFRAPRAIGASAGQPTPFLCFELDASTPIVHGYPISEAEAIRIKGDAPPIWASELKDYSI